MSRHRTRLAAGLLALIMVTVVPAHAAVAAEPTGTVTLVHGVRGLVADIYLDGAPVLKVFEPERITDALTLPAGAHTVEVRPTGAAADSAPLLSTTLNVVAGIRQSAVVHLDAAGKPALTVYVDDPTTLPIGHALVLVRHTAEAPTFAVTIDGADAMAGIASGGQSSQDVAAGSHVVAVTAASAALLPPREIAFAEGTITALYLVGSTTSANLAWLAETLPSSATAPAAVRTGNSPLEGTSNSTTTLAVWIAVAAVACFALATGMFRARGGTHRGAATSAAGLAGIAIGVTSLAVTARAPLRAGDRPALGDVSSPLAFAKVAGAPFAKSSLLLSATASSTAPSSGVDSLVVAIGSRPAGLDQIASAPTARPVTVSIQPGDIVAHVLPEGADAVTGEMQIPTDPKLVGWYEHGPVPGEPGSAVIAGHVAFDGKRGSFADLVDVEVGAVILVAFDDGSVRTFRVTERREYAKPDLPTDELFRRSGPATLTLITCGGTFSSRTHSYADNVVVSATLM